MFTFNCWIHYDYFSIHKLFQLIRSRQTSLSDRSRSLNHLVYWVWIASRRSMGPILIIWQIPKIFQKGEVSSRYTDFTSCATYELLIPSFFVSFRYSPKVRSLCITNALARIGWVGRNNAQTKVVGHLCWSNAKTGKCVFLERTKD